MLLPHPTHPWSRGRVPAPSAHPWSRGAGPDGRKVCPRGDRRGGNLEGGCLAKAEILETRQTHCGKTFVKIEKTAPWLARAVTGKPHSGRPLSRTHIIEAMRAKLHTGTIPAEAPASADAPDDPMAAMDYEDMADASAVAEPNLVSPPKQRKRLRRLRVEAEQLVSMAIATESWGGWPASTVVGNGGSHCWRVRGISGCTSMTWHGS